MLSITSRGIGFGTTHLTTVPQPQKLSKTETPLTIDSLWKDSFVLDGETGFVNEIAAKEFEAEAAGYINLIESEYKAISDVEKYYAKSISQTAHVYYHSVLYWYEIALIAQKNGTSSRDQDKHKIFKSTIQLCEVIGVKITSVTCDGLAGNFSMFTSLGCNVLREQTLTNSNSHDSIVHIFIDSCCKINHGSSKKKKYIKALKVSEIIDYIQDIEDCCDEELNDIEVVILVPDEVDEMTDIDEGPDDDMGVLPVSNVPGQVEFSYTIDNDEEDYSTQTTSRTRKTVTGPKC
ncbi:unnamed protein product [Arctia plantaginis]|uniref:Transposable element P transposase-like RNase H domain-containing protein n=1 Tax=Arctia plantaginis TaxID=874455 RepID=A0A8S0ZYJ3_ARCPL|nr:unnamed protein product [Arctia plantaginis]